MYKAVDWVKGIVFISILVCASIDTKASELSVESHINAGNDKTHMKI
jgi:hypothetical protein